MAVGDVDRRQGIEGAGELVDGRVVGDHPELVAHAVVGGDVDLRLAGGGLRQHGVDLRRVRVADHHRAGLRIDRLDLAHAVVFLHRRGQLVLADAVGGVVGERGDGGEAGLRAAAPGQPVDVIAGLGVAYQHAAVDHALRDFRRPWHRPPCRRGRWPDRGRSPAWRYAGSSTACRRRARALRRSRARHRAAPALRRRVRARGEVRGMVL